MEGSVNGIVFAESGTGNTPRIDKIARFPGIDALGPVPYDDSVPAAQDAGKPLLVYDVATPAVKTYWETTERLSTKLKGLEQTDSPLETALPVEFLIGKPAVRLQCF